MGPMRPPAALVISRCCSLALRVGCALARFCRGAAAIRGDLARRSAQGSAARRPEHCMVAMATVQM